MPQLNQIHDNLKLKLILNHKARFDQVQICLDVSDWPDFIGQLEQLIKQTINPKLHQLECRPYGWNWALDQIEADWFKHHDRPDDSLAKQYGLWIIEALRSISEQF